VRFTIPDLVSAAPEYTPDDVAQDYVEACDNLTDNRFKSAGIMFRRALETCLKHKFEDSGKERPLGSRIKKLCDDRNLTKELGDFAEHIKEIGNETTHGDNWSEAGVRDIQVLTEAIFRYLYTLPGMIAAAQHRQSP